MNKGKIKIRRKSNGDVSRFIQVPGGKKLGIPAVFIIPDTLHDVECEYESTREGIVRIVVNGKELDKDDTLLKAKEQKRKEQEEKARLEKEQQEAAAKQASQQPKGRLGGGSGYTGEQQAFNIENTKLPWDTRQALAAHAQQIDNFALRLQKCANFWTQNKGKPTLYQRVKGSKKLGTSNQIMRHTLPDAPYAHYGNIDFGLLCARAQETVSMLYENHRSLSLNLDGRLVMGIGGASVFETGFTLHPVFGFPYIPSSSLKGVVRSWIIIDAFGGNEGAALADKTFCDIFGCPSEWKKDRDSKFKSWYEINKKSDKESGDRIGNIIFCDALPTDSPVVKEDIMNVHYPDYYSGKTPPTDFQSPNPIPFLTVEKTTFQFLLGFKPLPGLENAKAKGPIAQKLGKQDDEITLLEAGKLWLIKALTDHGIGAKTAVGYGFFDAERREV